MTSLSGMVPGPGPIVCLGCGAIWDGSEVDRDKLPEILEQQITGGFCTREQAYTAFLRMDDLAEAAAKGEITEAQGAELVGLDALRIVGKARTQ